MQPESLRSARDGMPVVGLRTLLEEARRDGYGILAANVILLEHEEALAGAAEDVEAPIVLQISQNAVRYHGGIAPIAAACVALAERAATRIGLHLLRLFGAAGRR